MRATLKAKAFLQRTQRGARLATEVQRVWTQNHAVYGVGKVCHPLKREGHRVARAFLGTTGGRRGARVPTPTPAEDPHREDHGHRDFSASRPNEWWGSDFTCVATRSGFVYVAFVIDGFARRIVGWRVSKSMRTEFVAVSVILHPAFIPTSA